MRTGLFTLFIFLFAFAGVLRAQDTSMPAMMSQHAYDSTIRALKRASTIKKDTVKPIVKDTVKTMPKKNIVTDSVKSPPADTTHKASVGIRMTLKKDSVKTDTSKYKIRYRPTGYLALSYGETYPKGNFKLSSYPTQGGDFAFTAAFPGITSHIGFITEFEYGYNRFDQLRYTDSVNNRTNNIYLHYSMNSSVKTFYNHEALLFGIYYTYPYKRFSIDARILGGVMFGSIPAETVYINDVSDGNNLTLSTYQTSGRAFAWDEGISIRYLVYKGLSASLGIDNLSAPTSFTYVSNGIGSNVTGTAFQLPTQNNVVILPVHVFTVNIGVGYTIGAKH